MNKKILTISITGLMAALAYISFTFLQIKIPTPGGYTSFHLGNTFVVLAALIIGGVPGGIAGAIGMGIGDLLDPIYVTYAPKTIILKFLIGVITGLFAHHIFHINEQDGKKLYIEVIISSFAGLALNVIGEPIFSYFYNNVILNVPTSSAKILASWNLITTSTNAFISIVIATLIYIFIRPSLKKLKII